MKHKGTELQEKPRRRMEGAGCWRRSKLVPQEGWRTLRIEPYCLEQVRPIAPDLETAEHLSYLLLCIGVDEGLCLVHLPHCYILGVPHVWGRQLVRPRCGVCDTPGWLRSCGWSARPQAFSKDRTWKLSPSAQLRATNSLLRPLVRSTSVPMRGWSVTSVLRGSFG
ncbi:hypothetical protein BJY59DRAFT_688883 [Rhodotorula toruloides]